jgi:hypothetical protein
LHSNSAHNTVRGITTPARVLVTLFRHLSLIIFAMAWERQACHTWSGDRVYLSRGTAIDVGLQQVQVWLYHPRALARHGCPSLPNVFVNNITPWPNSANKLQRPSYHHLSAKLVPTFTYAGYHVVSVTDPYGRNYFDSPNPSSRTKTWVCWASNSNEY